MNKRKRQGSQSEPSFPGALMMMTARSTVAALLLLASLPLIAPGSCCCGLDGKEGVGECPPRGGCTETFCDSTGNPNSCVTGTCEGICESVSNIAQCSCHPLSMCDESAKPPNAKLKSKNELSMSQEDCETQAEEIGIPFIMRNTLDGAPAGCVRKTNPPMLIWVESCVTAAVCMTTNCNGCDLLGPKGYHDPGDPIGYIPSAAAGAVEKAEARLVLWHTGMKRKLPRRSSPTRAGLAAFLARNPKCVCLLYTSPSPRDRTRSRMPSSA